MKVFPNTISALAAALVAMLAVMLLAGCSHPLEVRGTGEGDITSSSSTRDCSLEDYQSHAANCAENWVVQAYDESYTATPRANSQFRRWANFCQMLNGNLCAYDFSQQTVVQAWGQTMPPLQAVFRTLNNTGFDALFIGNELFDPFAGAIETAAHTAGFTDHDTSSVFAAGASGAPLALWNNPAARAQIQAVLDGGEIDLFGMTYHADHATAEGYINWIRYALEQNPDTRVFIGTPWVSDPGSMTAAQFEAAYRGFHDTVPHALVDLLRAQFPGVDIYSVPYGQAAAELYNLWDDGTLATNGDVSALIGLEADAIFTDAAGQPGDILQALGTLVWLAALYDVDLDTYPDNPTYSTDLRAVAQAIMVGHDPNYNSPLENYRDTDGDGIADRDDADDDNDSVPDLTDACRLIGPDETGVGCPATATMSLVSIDGSGSAANDSSNYSDISADGRYVVFGSQATDIVLDGGASATGSDVYLYDSQLQTTRRVNTVFNPLYLNNVQPRIAGGGRYVAYISYGRLTPADTDNLPDVYMTDTVSGSISLASANNAGESANASVLGKIAVSDDGQLVLFSTGADNLVTPDTNGIDVFLRDVVAGTTERASVDNAGGEANGSSFFPRMSSDARYVVFNSSATNLAPNVTNQSYNIFLRDRVAGTTERASLSVLGEEPSGSQYAPTGCGVYGDDPCVNNPACFHPDVSDDGRYVVFQSQADNLVPGDNNNSLDIFVRDMQEQTTIRVSVDDEGGEANDSSEFAAISPNGRYVAFQSRASNLVPFDTNAREDIFVHDLHTGTTARATVNNAGEESNGGAERVAVSDSGHVTFHTLAYNLDSITDDDYLSFDVYLRRMQ